MSNIQNPLDSSLQLNSLKNGNQVYMKSGAVRDVSFLALMITHPRFEIGNSTHYEIVTWIRAKVDREKTANKTLKQLVIKSFNNIDFYYQKSKQRASVQTVAPKPAKTVAMDWVVSVKTKAWRSRLDAIINLTG